MSFRRSGARGNVRAVAVALAAPALALAFAFVVTVACIAPADAARLRVDGPDGARVRVDGKDVGVLPLAQPLEVAIGTHEVRLDLAGHHPGSLDVRINADTDDLRVRIGLDPIQKSRAVVHSLLLAGQGQRTVGRPKLGWLMTVVELGGIAAAITGEVQLQDEVDAYNEARERYDAGITPEEIADARSDLETAESAMDDAENLRNIGLGVAAGAVVWSVLDVLLRDPSTDAEPQVSLQPHFGPQATYGFALRHRF